MMGVLNLTDFIQTKNGYLSYFADRL